MERIEPTRKIALQIFWATFWRTLVLGAVTAFVVGCAFALLSMATGISSLLLDKLIPFISFIIVICVSTEVMYRVLRKKFKDFEIAIIPRQPQ